MVGELAAVLFFPLSFYLFIYFFFALLEKSMAYTTDA